MRQSDSATGNLVAALLDCLDEHALDELARRLAPRLPGRDVPPGPLTTRQAAERAGLHERSIRRALAAGTLAGATTAGRWRIATDDLNEWLALGAPTQAAEGLTNGRAARGAGAAGVEAIAGGKNAR